MPTGAFTAVSRWATLHRPPPLPELTPPQHAPMPVESHCDTVPYDNGHLAGDENQLDREIGCDPSTAKF
jgi:hypothetical protein